MTLFRDRKLEAEVRRRQATRAALRPLDQPQEARTVVVGEPQVFEFSRIDESVQIQMDRVHVR
jgi:hypothetical protein